MTQTHSIRTKLATLRQREQADYDELWHIDEMCLASGYSDFLDEIADRLGDARTVEGGTDERTFHRGVSRAGFATAFRY